MSMYHSTVGALAAPPESLTVPEFMLDNAFLQPNSNDPEKPDWVCLVDDATARQVRFSELRTRTGYLCAALHAQQTIKAGDIVALVAHNNIDYPVCVWAALRLGAIVAYGDSNFVFLLEADHPLSPMSPAMTPDELAHLFKLTKPSVIIVQNEGAALVSDGAKRAGLMKSCMLFMDATLNSEFGYPTTGSLIAHGKNLPQFSQPALKTGEGKTKVAFLCFSSGTTGMPKAVCISHYNVICNVLQTAALNHVYDPYLEWAEKRYRPGDACSGVLPLFHAYGLVFNLHFILYARMTLVITAKFNFEKMLDNISRYQITNLLIVPPQAILFCKHPAVQQYNLSSVRACMIAAAPISAELTQSFLRVLPGIHLGQGYGMTEASTAVSLYPISPKVGVLGSGGKLIPGTIAKILKEDGTLAPIGQCGELYVQGPQVTLGYFNNPTATNETFIDGWLRTGDEARFDAEGNLFIVGRVKELIKVKGHQVAPAELEGHLLGHEDIADAAVIGISDDFAGEVPLAFVVLKPQAASRVKNNGHDQKMVRESIFKHVAASKSSYKWLTGGIEFVEFIPKSASGKILRLLLREQSAKGLPQSKL